MIMVRAKFTVVEKTETADASFSVRLTPIINGSEENKSFYKWTPGGQIQLSTINKDAAEQLQPGKSYYVDFTKAED
jgi:hypothetical protein